LGLEEARRNPNARTRNRRNEARLLLFAFADSDHGRDYKRRGSNGQTTGGPNYGLQICGRNIKAL
jgi:hypothetical protein